MRFTKMQATGNDFILVRASSQEKDWPAIAQQACERHLGIGADGLILILPSRDADVAMRIFNPDGSEAEMCGNGIRCLAKEVVEEGIAQPKDGRISVETPAGVLTAALQGENGIVETVRVGMGRPRIEAGAIPVATEADGPVIDLPLEVGGLALSLTCLSMGNPHAVHFISTSVSNFPLAEIGPLVERHPIFPRRTNFEVARVNRRNAIDVRVWERGAGPTLACGTGACAVAVAARLHGLADNIVDITLPGGVLSIEWDGVGEVFLSGPAERVFTGDWRLRE